MKSDVIGLRLVFLVAFAGGIILEGRSTPTNAESESEAITPLAVSFCAWDFPRRTDVYGIHLSPVIMCGQGPWNLYGVSVGILNSSVLAPCGIQFAGGLSTASSDVYGIQFAGLGSVIFSGGVDSTVYGAQIAGVMVGTDHLRGVQIAGLYAGASTAIGLQVGLINFAKEVPAGGVLVQIGLVNNIGSRILPLLNAGW